MAGQNWSITIAPGSPFAEFEPDVFTASPAEPGAPLQAQLGDLVSWNNQTDDPHEIWVTNEDYEPKTKITDRIEPYKSSIPGYVTQAQDVTPSGSPPAATIFYYCSIHTDEHGQIDIVT